MDTIVFLTVPLVVEKEHVIIKMGIVNMDVKMDSLRRTNVMQVCFTSFRIESRKIKL